MPRMLRAFASTVFAPKEQLYDVKVLPRLGLQVCKLFGLNRCIAQCSLPGVVIFERTRCGVGQDQLRALMRLP